MADVLITTQIGSPCVNWLEIHHVRPAAAAAGTYIEEAIASTQRNTSKASVRRVRREGLIDNGSQIKSEKKNDREGKKQKLSTSIYSSRQAICMELTKTTL
jgi:hypothetical protein